MYSIVKINDYAHTEEIVETVETLEEANQRCRELEGSGRVYTYYMARRIDDTDVKQVTHNIAKAFGLAQWDAEHRVEFNISELGYDPQNLTPENIYEITRCIAADLKAGK